MPPKVTVCIPTYNRAHLVKEAIQSVLNQTCTDLQVLVTDNASTDSTSQVVASFNDPRIRYHRHPRNIGMMGNFRSAVTMADTDWVAILPDDDLYQPDHLQFALNALALYPQATYYACPAQYFGGYTTGCLRPKAITDTQTPLLYFEPKQAVGFLGVDNPGPLHIVCKRTAFDQNMFWGQGDFPAFDMLILTQLMAQGGFVFGNRSTTRFRIHETNASIARGQKVPILRYNCMVWYGIRWLSQFLLDNKLCTLDDIEAHGRHATSELHIVPLVLALGSFDSPQEWRTIAKCIFEARGDMDRFSLRFRLARRIGFWVMPVLEKISQVRTGWHP